MEIQPRLKTVKAKPVPAPLVAAPAPVEPVDEKAPDMIDAIKGFFGNTVILVVVFAIIVVILIVVVVWLVCRNDKFMSWLPWGHSPPPKKDIKKKETEKPKENVADDDELAKYATYVKTDETPSHPPKADEKPKEPTETKVSTVLDIDAEIEHELNARMDALEENPIDTAASVISDDVNAEVSKMDAVQNREIERVSKKLGTVVETYPTNDSISRAGYDINTVLQCCRGEKQSHKNHIWRFADSDVEAPPL